MVNVTIYTIILYMDPLGYIYIYVFLGISSGYICDNSCKSGWWFQPTPLKNDGGKVSWDSSSYI